MKTDEEKMKETFCAFTAIQLISSYSDVKPPRAYAMALNLWDEHRKHFKSEPEE